MDIHIWLVHLVNVGILIIVGSIAMVDQNLTETVENAPNTKHSVEIT